MSRFRLATLLLALVLLTGCSVRATRESPPLPADAGWALLPVVNLADTPDAGERVETLLASLLRARGLAALRLYPHDTPKDEFPELDQWRRYRVAEQWARSEGFRYAIAGSVAEWRYKAGLDGEPAVGVTLQVLDLEHDEVVWSASGSRAGWGRESLSGAAIKLLQDLLESLRLIADVRQ